jgi:hypothetical protein
MVFGALGSMPSGDPPKERHEFLGMVGKVIGLLGGLAYLSGYLIVQTFFSRFGVPPSGEVLRLRYVYVGALYMLLPFLFGVPVLFIRRHKAHVGAVGGNQQPPHVSEEVGVGT